MPLDDRDWYRDELRKKEGYVERADFRVPSWARASKLVTERNARPRPRPWRAFGPRWWLLNVVIWGAVLVLRDMRQRGVPLSWRGLKWWLSLWFGA